MISFEGRHVVVAGGGSGIGLAAVTILAALGADVFMVDIDRSVAAHTAQMGPKVKFHCCDATQPEQVDAMLKSAETSMGAVDGLFTTVGGSIVAPLAEVDLAAWHAQLSFNLDSAYIVGRAALPYLARSGKGALVTTSSGFALMSGVERIPYVVAKAGVIALTRSLAAAAAPAGTRVNCIAPGPTDTKRFRNMNGDEGAERIRRAVPLGKIPSPDDCARAAIFLLSDWAGAITGQTLHVNGGMLMP
jgi:NAD(P)-dependent dehydrogenase (short-subunit alcohol dehydrogenase family)